MHLKTSVLSLWEQWLWRSTNQTEREKAVHHKSIAPPSQDPQ